jgi:hypothetical protein
MSDVPDEIWRWIRREMDDQSFESWVYRSEALAPAVGHEVYSQLIELDYRDDYAKLQLRDSLARSLARACPCPCPLFRDQQYLPLSRITSEVLGRYYKELRERTPWLHLLECIHGHHWYQATDSVDDEGWYLQRLTRSEARAIADHDEWPRTFDRVQYVWPQEQLISSPSRPEGFCAGSRVRPDA